LDATHLIWDGTFINPISYVLSFPLLRRTWPAGGDPSEAPCGLPVTNHVVVSGYFVASAYQDPNIYEVEMVDIDAGGNVVFQFEAGYVAAPGDIISTGPNMDLILGAWPEKIPALYFEIPV
jgi:hypothetical protein